MKAQGRWQDDPEFVAWLKSMNYLANAKELYMSAGVYLYMYEAWCAGVDEVVAQSKRLGAEKQ